VRYQIISHSCYLTLQLICKLVNFYTTCSFNRKTINVGLRNNDYKILKNNPLVREDISLAGYISFPMTNEDSSFLHEKYPTVTHVLCKYMYIDPISEADSLFTD